MVVKRRPVLQQCSSRRSRHAKRPSSEPEHSCPLPSGASQIVACQPMLAVVLWTRLGLVHDSRRFDRRAGIVWLSQTCGICSNHTEQGPFSRAQTLLCVVVESVTLQPIVCRAVVRCGAVRCCGAVLLSYQAVRAGAGYYRRSWPEEESSKMSTAGTRSDRLAADRWGPCILARPTPWLPSGLTGRAGGQWRGRQQKSRMVHT